MEDDNGVKQAPPVNRPMASSWTTFHCLDLGGLFEIVVEIHQLLRRDAHIGILERRGKWMLVWRSQLHFSLQFQRKKTLCKSIMYGAWTGIPYLNIVRFVCEENLINALVSFSSRTSTGDDSFVPNTELYNYIHEYFWPYVRSCTVRLTHVQRDALRDCKPAETQWTIEVHPRSRSISEDTISLSRF